MTHRQFLAWNAWLAEQWNQPDRTDHYLAQVACEVRRGNAKKPRAVKLEHLILEFKQSRKGQRVSREEAAARSKSRWIALAGGKVEHRVVTQEEMDRLYPER